MKYFQMLPKLAISDTQSTQIVTNLLARVNIVSSMLNDPLIFYTYDIQEGDTPEIIAHKYYDDMEKFWIVLMSNQAFDPQWDWPLTSSVFNDYLIQKYGESHINEIHHYEKIVTKTGTTTRTVTTETFIIDEDSYNSLNASSETYITNTEPVIVDITKSAVDNFAYEYLSNESKRNIKILNKNYADRLEVEFRKLMGT